MDLNRSHLLRRTLCARLRPHTGAGPGQPCGPLAAGGRNPPTTPRQRCPVPMPPRWPRPMRRVEALVNSSAYDAMDLQQRQAAAAQEQLDQLASQGLIQADSVRYDQENNLYSFTYDCGGAGRHPADRLGGRDEDEELVQLPLTVPEELAFNPLDQTNDVMPLGNAIVYYAFDDTVDSNRYPYYTTMQEYWNGPGAFPPPSTTMSRCPTCAIWTTTTCASSAPHGALLFLHHRGGCSSRYTPPPILVLREESSFWDDLRYGFDLLTHRVIKVNGVYCITPSFFESAYRGGQLNGTMIFSEACEFFGTRQRHRPCPCPPPCWTAGPAPWPAFREQRLRHLFPQYAVGAPSTS